jgi:hypothetical protein
MFSRPLKAWCISVLAAAKMTSPAGSFLVKRERSFACRSWDRLEKDPWGDPDEPATPRSRSCCLVQPLDSLFITKNDEDRGNADVVCSALLRSTLNNKAICVWCSCYSITCVASL